MEKGAKDQQTNIFKDTADYYHKLVDIYREEENLQPQVHASSTRVTPAPDPKFKFLFPLASLYWHGKICFTSFH